MLRLTLVLWLLDSWISLGEYFLALYRFQLRKEPLKNNNCAGSPLVTINKKRGDSPSLLTSKQLNRHHNNTQHSVTV